MEEILRKYKDGDELELRFGFFERTYFKSNVNYFTYINLLNIYTRNPDYGRWDQRYHIRRFNKVRTITDEQGVIETTLKVNKGNHDILKNGVRVSLSKEEISPSTGHILSGPVIERKRSTFTPKDENGLYKIDITDDFINEKHYFQYEIEFLSKPSLWELKDTINGGLGILQHIQTLRLAIKTYNRLYSSDRVRKSDDRPYIKSPLPKNIQTYDFPYLEYYRVFVKLDGLSYYIYFSDNNSYLINKSGIELYFQGSPSSLAGTIVIGEYLKDVDEMYIYDILFKNFQDVRTKPLPERYKFLEEVIKESPRKLNIIPLTTNQTQSLKNTILEVSNSSLAKNKPNDGLIFQPLTYPYNNIYNRKWKFPKDITIDFVVSKVPNYRYVELYSYGKGKNNPPVLFKGTYRYPHPSYIPTTQWLDNIPNYSIVEFGLREGKLVPVKLRPDKVKPNFIEVAKSTWVNMMEPITFQDMLDLSDTVIIDKNKLQINSKICKFLRLTHDPRIFDDLSSFIGNSEVEIAYRQASAYGIHNKKGNELVNILYRYFNR